MSSSRIAEVRADLPSHRAGLERPFLKPTLASSQTYTVSTLDGFSAANGFAVILTAILMVLFLASFWKSVNFYHFFAYKKPYKDLRLKPVALVDDASHKWGRRVGLA